MRAGIIQKISAFEMRGKFGFSGGFGRITFGYNRFGFCHPLSGIYQKKYYYGKPFISQKRFSWGADIQSDSQLACRLVFKNAVRYWHYIPDEGRRVYTEKAKRLKMTGFNLFISDFIHGLIHTPPHF